MKSIIDELNFENGANYKISVLKKHKDNELLKKLLKLTYDHVQYTFGISMKNILPNPATSNTRQSLEYALEQLEQKFATREVTGNAAQDQLEQLFTVLSEDDAYILECVINRDLRINMGRTSINKAFKGLITKTVYMRCDVLSADEEIIDSNGQPVLDRKNKPKIAKGTINNIDFSNKAILQLKADGTYREFHSLGETIECNSRSGEEYFYPKIFDDIKNIKPGKYHGELTVKLTADLLEKLLPKLEKSDIKNGTSDAQELARRFETEGEFILPRGIGNGLIKSDDVPHDNLVLDLWDYIPDEEYAKAALKDKHNLCTIPYAKRLEMLRENIKECGAQLVNVVETHEVSTVEEAFEIVSKWMEAGLEGGILKDKSGVFKDGTSKHQLKMKLVVEADVRIVGFTPGTGKNSDYFGAVVFENDEGTIKGRVGVSSMKEEERDWFHENRVNLIGKIIEVQFNNLSKARGNLYYSLSHPRYIELRDDKDIADTLEKVQNNQKMAMQLKSRKDAK